MPVSPLRTEPVDKVAGDVLESLLEGCQVIGFDWTYVYVNAAIVAQGRRTRDELLGLTMMECYPGIEHTPMFAAIRRCMIERIHHRMENEFRFPDGQLGWFELRMVPVPEGVCVLSLDITETKRAAAALERSEEQLRQAQKMEAIGRLAGGVAHDFNNLLSVILSYASLALQSLPSGDPLRDDLSEIDNAGRRAAELTKQLLAFSRQQVRQPRVMDLNDSLVEVDRMLRRVLGADVELKLITAPSLWPVLADPGQIQQILMNLVVNARDAMPGGGKLTIETANVELDEAYARDHLGTQSGPHVMMAVSDSGVGMDRETQSRIFEPFYTTKEAGKGTGLGLSTCYGIVKQSGGSIWVYSEPGKGSTFKIYLPRAADHVEAVAERPRPTARGGNETVLLAEDDQQLRKLTHTILTRAGYHVLVAQSPAEALALSAAHTGQIDLLLTDVVMPGLNGRQLADQLAATRPTMKVLFMSGYTGDVVVHHGVLAEGVAFLQKPLTPDAVTRALREVLDA